MSSNEKSTRKKRQQQQNLFELILIKYNEFSFINQTQ